MQEKAEPTKDEQAMMIEADIFSRPMFMNGFYRNCRIGLDSADLSATRKDLFHLESLRMRADLADKMIGEAITKGLDPNDKEAMKKLGSEICAIGHPIPKTQSRMTAFFVSIQIAFYFGVVIGIWGLVLNQSFWTFGLYGSVLFLLISLALISPVVSNQRTKEQIRKQVDGIGLLLGGLGTIIGVIGIIILIVKFFLFR
jgi:uncharacterized membrane protein